MGHPVLHHLSDVLPFLHSAFQKQKRLGYVAGQHLLRQLDVKLLRDRPQKLQDLVPVQTCLPGGHALFQDTQGVTHRSVCVPCQKCQRTLRDLNAVLLADPGHVGLDLSSGHPPKIQSHTPGQYRLRQLLRVGGGQYEHHMCRRFLQCFQECVERPGRQHVDLVDDIDLPPSCTGRIIDTLPQLPDVLHTVVGCRIDLDHIDEIPLRDRAATGTLPTGALTFSSAVHRLGQDPGRGGLASAPGSTEQIGMAHRVRGDLVPQNPNDLLLSQDLVEHLRSVLPVQSPVLLHSVSPRSIAGDESHRSLVLIKYLPFNSSA